MNKTTAKASLLAVALVVLIPLGLRAQDEGFYPYSFARLSYVNGTVYVQRTSDLGYEKGEINLALVQGDKMGTESGQAEVHFGRRNYLRIDDNTKAEFAVLPSEGDERIRIHLTEGSAYLRVSQLIADKSIEIHTPDASFYVLEEGLYRFDVRLDAETRASVREGSLEAAAEDGSVLVKSNESVAAADGRLLGDPQYAYSQEDRFDSWNRSRDAQLAARSERRYLPSEIGEYEEELDQYGHWVYERGYGNVWVPNVTYVDWRPYLYGRWVWYPVIGWTWVSAEPWGWSVYHYGRWHWRFGLGWYWIPHYHWGPAWVHWWWNRDHIGWCPLSWYNRPVLLVDNHFYDRHYDRYYSPHNRAMTVVRRDQLQAHDIHRRQLGVADRGRIDKVEFRAEQPSLRPVVDNSRPQALAARRVLAAKPGSRSDVKSVTPSNSLSPSRMRPGAVNSQNRAEARRASVESSDRAVRTYPTRRSSVERDQAGLSGRSAPRSEARTIRSYPSQRSSEDRRGSIGSPARKSEGETGSAAARVSRPAGRASEPAQPRTVREPQTIRNDTKGRGDSSRTSVSRTPSRLSASPRDSSPSRSSSSVSRPPSSSRSGSSSRSSSSPPRSSYSGSSRSTSPSYSRSSSSRAPSYSQPRSSYSAPSRSSGSSGRAVSAPRPSSSAAGRSYTAPRPGGSSSARSYSAPRSGGSSGSGRSSSPSRSGTSSSRSSGTSSKSGSVKRKD